MFVKLHAREALAEAYISNDNHNRAVKAFEEAEAIRLNAWGLVYELYPKLKDKGIHIRCDMYKKLIIIVS